MANLRTAMDAAFWDLNISTPQALDGTSRAIPGEPIPLDSTRASKALRIQQLSFLGNGFPLGIIPLHSPSPNHKELGSFALQSLLGKVSFRNWWLGFVGQFRPKKLITNIITEIRGAEELELAIVKDVGKHFLDKSLYAANLCSQISLTSSSSLLLSTEKHGEKKGRRTRAMLLHKLPDHDITFEAAWPELFIDHKGKYWEVPESVSLDCSSLVAESGLRYRFGIHRNRGTPQVVNSSDSTAPSALLPGLCAKAAFSYEKNKDLWREKEKKEDVIIETEQGQFWRPSYDIRLREPHASVSGIIGSTCAAWFGGRKNFPAVESTEGADSASGAKSRSPIEVDLYGSACYTYQHGKFRELFGDLSRIDARLDISSASTLAKKVSKLFSGSSNNGAPNLPPSVGLNFIFQQQVVGPIVFRLNSQFSLDSWSKRRGPQLEDFVCSLNYSLRLLQSGKVVAWYSPKRKEGMIELRLFEF